MGENMIRLSADLSVDAVEYASRANAVLGIRDSGKTWTATLVAEQLFNCGIPFFAFDPIGRWRFLKVPSGSDLRVHGGPKGFPVVVLGGAEPDIPFGDPTPQKVADAIRSAMKCGVSMVIDLYDVKLSKSQWRMIVRTAIETVLYENEAHGGGLRHVFLEEAAEFAPQRVQDGMTYSVIEKLVRMGGNAGVGVTLINQRAEELNKAVLELCDNLLLHRQRGKNSLLSLRKWLEAGNVKPPKEITDSLSDLPTGQCWAWFKDVGKPKLIQVGRKQSFDPNRRAMTKSGTKIVFKAVDVSAFVEQMKSAFNSKPVAAKKEDPDVKESEAKALRAENADLKKRVADLEAMMSGETIIAAGAISPEEMRAKLSGMPSGGGKLVVASDPADLDYIYAEVIRRAKADPGVLKILASRPEIEVEVTRKVVRVDGATLKGRIAQMIADGFYDGPRTNNATTNELKRRAGGTGVNFGNLAREMKSLASDGFLTLEGEGYQAVAGMKVNIVEVS